tara:strand:+ start:18445 stop:19041 length:597 start_codon:yes stop_codon:yes gene_type:complete
MTEILNFLFSSPEGVVLACDPVVLGTMLVISAASHASQYQQQKYTAEATEKKQREMAAFQAQETQMASVDAQNQKQDIQRRQHGEEQELKRRGMLMRGQAVTSAGEAGLSGASFDALVNDYWSRESQLAYASQTEAQLASAKIDTEMQRIELSGGSRLASIYQPIQQAQAGQAVLGFAGDALDIGGDFKGKRGMFRDS